MTEPERPLTRADVANAVENRREFLEARVEAVREELAADVEADREIRADEAEVTRAELAAILEADRKAHNARIAGELTAYNQRVALELTARTKVINRRFAFLFAFLLVVLAILAYRSEINARNLEDGLHQACQQRAALAQTYNTSNPGFPPLPVQTCTGEEQPTQ